MSGGCIKLRAIGVLTGARSIIMPLSRVVSLTARSSQPAIAALISNPLVWESYFFNAEEAEGDANIGSDHLPLLVELRRSF